MLKLMASSQSRLLQHRLPKGPDMLILVPVDRWRSNRGPYRRGPSVDARLPDDRWSGFIADFNAFITNENSWSSRNQFVANFVTSFATKRTGNIVFRCTIHEFLQNLSNENEGGRTRGRLGTPENNIEDHRRFSLLLQQWIHPDLTGDGQRDQ